MLLDRIIHVKQNTVIVSLVYCQISEKVPQMRKEPKWLPPKFFYVDKLLTHLEIDCLEQDPPRSITLMNLDIKKREKQIENSYTVDLPIFLQSFTLK